MSGAAPLAERITRALAEAGVRPMLLRDGMPASEQSGFRPVQLAVRREDAERALAAIEPMDWRYSWTRGGLLKRVPVATYGWDGGRIVELLWGLPAAPTPSWALADLWARLWQSADAHGAWARASLPAAMVHLAVQASRSGRRRDGEWSDLIALLRAADQDQLAEAAQIADDGRVLPAWQHALRALERGGRRAPPNAVYEWPVEGIRLLAEALQRPVRHRRLGRLLAGAPIFGDAEIRCRVAGVEVRAGAGVFVPAPSADHIHASAVQALEGRTTPVVIEVGTGCGAIALGVAHSRPDARVIGCELSGAAIRSARGNAARLALGNVAMLHGSLLEPVRGLNLPPADLVVANLPYMPEEREYRIGSVPAFTITGHGADGLDLQRSLAEDARRILRTGGTLLLQMLPRQWEAFAPELRDLGYRPHPPLLVDAFAICIATLERAA